MFQNVINTAFEGAATTGAGVELLDAFNSLARREAIKRCVEKKSAEVFAAISNELSVVKKGFDKAKAAPPLLHRDHPKYAGAALWARSLHLRVQRQWHLLEASSKTAEDLAEKTPEVRVGVGVRVRRFVKGRLGPRREETPEAHPPPRSPQSSALNDNPHLSPSPSPSPTPTPLTLTLDPHP